MKFWKLRCAGCGLNVHVMPTMFTKFNAIYQHVKEVNVGKTITIVVPLCCTSCVFTSIFLAIVITVLFFSYLLPMDIYYALTNGSLVLLPYAVRLPWLPFIIRRINKYVTQESQNSFHNHISQTNSRRAGEFYFDSLVWAWKK